MWVIDFVREETKNTVEHFHYCQHKFTTLIWVVNFDRKKSVVHVNYCQHFTTQVYENKERKKKSVQNFGACLQCTCIIWALTLSEKKN